MRKFSIPGRYFIVHGRYLCPGVFPARGGWPWNAGNARFPEGPGRAGSLKVGSGSGGFGDGSGNGGFRDGSGNGFGSWWLQGWFQGRFPGVGAGWFRSGSGRMRGRFPGEVPGGSFGGGYGHGGRPSDGDVRAGWFGAAGSGPGKGVYGFFGREVCLNHTVCC